MKGDMEVEILKEPSDAAHAKQRMAKCVMTPAEQALYRYAPNAARGNIHPGYPDEDYGEMEV